MGTKKTGLMRGDRYGLLKAAELAAELIADYERGRDGAIKIRVECLDDDSWDDIEVTHRSRIDRWQVKRVKENLAFVDASKLVASAGGGNGTRRILGVAAFVPIKDGVRPVCNLRDLAELCAEARKPGVEAALFATREQKKRAFKFVTRSLASGTNQSDVLATLQHLHVEELGLEDALRARARTHLHDVFTNADEVVEQIHTWFLKHPDGTVEVDVALLYKQVVERYATRDPARQRWIHLSRDPVRAIWACRGPLAHQELVKVAWDVGHGRIQLGTPPRMGEAVSRALTRLALHRVDSVSLEAAITDAPKWKEDSAALCGGTLGNTTTQAQLACDPLTASTQGHSPCSEPDTPTFAGLLTTTMDERTWSLYVDAVDKHLAQDDLEGELRKQLREEWIAWHTCLDADATRRSDFLRSMLATVEEWERTGFDASVRMGPVLVDDLARATVVALAVAAAFTGSSLTIELGASGDISNLRLGAVLGHVVALSAASHPDERTPYRLAYAAGPMFASEAGIAILGVVEASASDLFDIATEEAAPFHASDLASQNFRHAGSPPPILTANPKFVAALSHGVGALRAHLSEMLGRMNNLRIESLQRALDGASKNA